MRKRRRTHRPPPRMRLRRADRRPANATANIVGLALLFTAAGLAASAVLELAAGDDAVLALGGSAALVAAVGALLWVGTRVPARVSTASAFSAVAWTWIAISVAGALPYWWSGMLPDFDDALFESISGFTGTGATVLSPIEGHGRGLLMWRQATQWYGGMGVIVLAVAVLPLLGVGGFELLRAESPGPTSDRLAPRVSETARRLWFVYLGMTVVFVAALLAVGLSPYDAVAHAFTTVSTGGFSPYNASIAAFESLAVELVLIPAMLAGAVSFALWWQVVRGAGWRSLTQSAELRVFLALAVVATSLVTVLLVGSGDGVTGAVRDAAFTVASTISTTGYATADFGVWPAGAQIVLLGLMVSGGMAGSTSGAAKLFRVQVMVSHAWRELRRIAHPRAVLPLKLGGQVVPEAIVSRIVGFFVLYITLAIVGTGILAALGADLTTAVGSIVSAIGAFGPGLGETGPVFTYLNLERPARWVVAVYMLLGRLELFTLLLMFVAPMRALQRRRRIDDRAQPMGPRRSRGRAVSPRRSPG